MHVFINEVVQIVVGRPLAAGADRGHPCLRCHRSQIGEGGAENNRFALKAPNALTFFLSDGFIEKVRLLVHPPKLATLVYRRSVRANLA